MADGRLNQCKDCVITKHKKDYRKNIIKHKVRRKKRYWADRENNIKKSVDWAKQNKPKRRIIQQRWREKHPFRNVVANKNWFSRYRGAEGRFSVEDLEEKIQKNHGKCWYCLVGDTYTIDHIIPISRGGNNTIDNIVPCCLRCNSQKRDLLLQEWLKIKNCFCNNPDFKH